MTFLLGSGSNFIPLILNCVDPDISVRAQSSFKYIWEQEKQNKRKEYTGVILL